MSDLISRQAVIDVRGKRVLDPCCGSRMFWFDKENKDVVFCDNRELHTTLCDGRKLDISPDIVCDFTDLPFEDNTFYHVVFDPPHMNTLGKNSWMAKKYGTLKGEDWQKLIREGFWECMRVLKPNGTLIFKWNEQDIPVSMVLKTIGARPMYGHKSGKLQKTHWMAFLKQGGTGAYDIGELPSAQPERTCVNCGRTANNGGWYADGRTRCPIEEHYALPKDGYCHLWEKRNVTDDDYPERREE